MSENLLETRLLNLEPLTKEDWRGVFQSFLNQGGSREEMKVARQATLQARIDYELMVALKKMDCTSTKLASRMLMLTWVLVIFTAALLVEPVVHFVRWLIHA